MIGPALTQLFVALNKRKDKLTEFEKTLHRELLGELVAKQFAESTLVRGAVLGGSIVASSSTQIEVTGNDLRNMGIGGSLQEVFGSGPTLKLQVDLSGADGDGSRKMQINCGKPDCPNKEYK